MSYSSNKGIFEFDNFTEVLLLLILDEDPILTLNKLKDFDTKNVFCANNLIKLFIKKEIFGFLEMIDYFDKKSYKLEEYMVEALKVAYAIAALKDSKLTSSLDDIRDFKYEINLTSNINLESTQLIDKKNEVEIEESNKPKVIIDPDEFKLMRQSIKIHMQENKRGFYLELKRSKELAAYLDKQARYYCEQILTCEKIYNLNSLEAKEIVLAEMLGLL